MEDRWLSVEEVIQYLGVSRDTIYNWIAGRGMPACRVGRLWKFKKEAVDAWVQSGGAGAARATTTERGCDQPATGERQAGRAGNAEKQRGRGRRGE